MAKRGWHGLLLVGTSLVLTQVGAEAQLAPARVVTGPSQGALPANENLARSPGGGGGGDSPQASQSSASPRGGGGGRNDNIVPVAQPNPDGPDAVAVPSATARGGGGGPVPSPYNPFILVLPGGDAADWTRSPSPGSGP